MTEFDRDKLVSDVKALEDFNSGVVEQFRTNGGRVDGFADGLLLLHTTGAKSGKPRLSPLAYLEVDGRMLIVGSYGGAPKEPAWVHNLRANPHARIEVGTDAYEVVARELPRAERDELYPRVGELNPNFAKYQTMVDRVIPLFELTRA
ncbi:nitroreductase family deazaflavin-dependent oxidoreductase [Nocardia sp. NPDC051570]|uniref:nitroreductase family deazaflavin-dependent oxidoreductase n=1 Tax=Nocardia sp. NPDC051570 TaxID=3364324 RepID=UPI0037B42374